MENKNYLLWSMIDNQTLERDERFVLEAFKKGRSDVSQSVNEEAKGIQRDGLISHSRYVTIKKKLLEELSKELKNKYPETHKVALQNVFPPMKKQMAEEVMAILNGVILFKGEMIFISQKHFNKDLYDILPSELLSLEQKYKTFKNIHGKSFSEVCRNCGFNTVYHIKIFKDFISKHSN